VPQLRVLIFVQVDSPTPTVGSGVITYNDTAVCADNTYRYQVRLQGRLTPTTSDPTCGGDAVYQNLLESSFESGITNWGTAVSTTALTSTETTTVYDGTSLKLYQLSGDTATSGGFQ
jgi:hypothetical protein